MSRLRLQAAAGPGAAGHGDREPLDSTDSITDHDATPSSTATTAAPSCA